MNINEEKAHIYSMLQDITAERRKLTDLYFGMKERLDELHKLEQRGLTDLSLKGYVDLYNQHQKRSVEQQVSNIEREAKHVVHKIKEEAKPVEKELPVPRAVIEEAKALESQSIVRKRGKRSEYLNIDKVMGNIVFVLKESGKPMANLEVYEKVNAMMDGQIGKQNFKNNILPRTIKKHNKIKKPERGYVQYITE